MIERTDLTHGGRKSYQIMQYDGCGCLVENYYFYASYEGREYTENDSFGYNDEKITMQEFEAMVDSIEEVSANIHEEVTVYW